MAEKIMVHNHSRGFKIYLSIMASLGVILLAAILALLIYGGLKISQESKTITTKVNSFNQQITNLNHQFKTINKNLTKIDNQLKTTKTSISNIIPSGL